MTGATVSNETDAIVSLDSGGGMELSEADKALVKDLIERGEPLPERFRWSLFAEPRETELIWPGKTNEVTTAVLPFQSIEQIDEPRAEADAAHYGTGDLFTAGGRQMGGWTNKLIWGDNKLVLSSLKGGPLRREIENAGGLKLVYIDPPFDVGADFSFEIEVGGEDFTKAPSVIEDVAYRDTWGQGINSYVAMLQERIRLAHELLDADGQIYIHCDRRVVAFVRLILDEVFGSENFRNEIIWCYRGGATPTGAFAHKHDTILRYSKTETYYFDVEPVRIRKRVRIDLNTKRMFSAATRCTKITDPMRAGSIRRTGGRFSRSCRPKSRKRLAIQRKSRSN